MFPIPIPELPSCSAVVDHEARRTRPRFHEQLHETTRRGNSLATELQPSRDCRQLLICRTMVFQIDAAVLVSWRIRSALGATDQEKTDALRNHKSLRRGEAASPPRPPYSRHSPPRHRPAPASARPTRSSPGGRTSGETMPKDVTDNVLATIDLSQARR